MKRFLSLVLLVFVTLPLFSQHIYQYNCSAGQMVFFNESVAKHIPHMVRMQAIGLELHNQIWNTDSNSRYVADKPLLYFTDWCDDGNGGVNAFPWSNIQIGMAPMNMSFYVAPSVERYYHLFTHEQTHVVMTDKATKADMGWRKFFGSKIYVDNRHPMSAIWSYFTTPRWYSPRWYQEGIACFLETWMGGGMGRAIGGYDEMYFRSLVYNNSKMSSVVGLESEGTASDFQLGTNAYLYGTRFVNYLVLAHGFDSLVTFYNRTEGSSMFFARQFKKTYGQSVRKVWKEWQAYEKEHQEQNLAAVRALPVTPTQPITAKALGSVSQPVYDPATRTIYTAVNHPGKFARLVSINMDNGKIKKLAYIDDPRLYVPSYLCFDQKRNRIIYTSQNQNYRGLRVYDLKKHRIVKRLNFQRLSNVVYDNTNDCMYAFFTSQGVIHLVCVDSTLKNKTPLFSFPFGVEVFDLAISHDGTMLSATMSGDNGEHSLILFNINDLKQANFKYTVLKSFPDANLGGFNFSLDDRFLIGSSYYTGVSDLWRIDIATGEMQLMSNSELGLFTPVEISADTLLALQFEREGMRPVLLKEQVLEDANAISFMGQEVYDRDEARLSELGKVKRTLPHIDFGEVTDSITKYSPMKEMRFAGAYPDLTGFVDREACNNVTPVLGYMFRFQDPVGFNRLNIHFGISPWSHNNWENRFHLDVDWTYRWWHFTASWNHTDFYDLLGPMQTSRKGYSFSLGYSRMNTLRAPLKTHWGVTIAAYGLMDALPLAQNVRVDIRSMQSLFAFYHISKTRKSLGGVKPEQGWEFGTDDYVNLVAGHFYPTLTITANGGVLLPYLRNTSIWLKNNFGSNFGGNDEAFSYEYFGGFRMNYIDCSTPYRVAGLFDYNAMPGAELDQIRAKTYLRSHLQLDICPLRFNNFGALGIYPTWAQLSPFVGYLNASGDNYLNYGAELNIEVMLFNYLKTTWSIGFARIHGFNEMSPFGNARNEWMFSLKLF